MASYYYQQPQHRSGCLKAEGSQVPECPICGTPVSEQEQFCPKCGAEQFADDGQYWDEPPYAGVYGAELDEPVSPAYIYARDKATEPLGPLSFLGAIIAMSLPVIGLVIQIIWAVGGTRSVNKKNLARAYLILSLIGAILALLAYIYVFPMISDFFLF